MNFESFLTLYPDIEEVLDDFDDILVSDFADVDVYSYASITL